MNRYAPLSELGRHQVAGSNLFKAQLWVRVDVTAQDLYFRLKAGDVFDQLHGVSACRVSFLQSAVD
jgi:hypothetical protein